MQNITPFPQKTTIVKKPRKTESPKQPQQFNYIKMTAAIVAGNGIVLAGLIILYILLINSMVFMD